MKARRILAVLLVLGMVAGWGCQNRPKITDKQDRNLELLLRELSFPDPGAQSRAATDLLAMPPDQLKPVLGQLEEIQKNERQPMVKKQIAEVIKRAKGG